MLKQKKPMTRKLSIALFISLLVLTPLISILSPALSKNAYADNGSAFNEVLLRAQAWSIINSFLYYSGGDGSRPISNLNIKNDTSGNAAQNCDIWSAGGYVVVGDYVTGKFGHSFGTNKPYQTWDNMQEGQGLANANNALKAVGFDGCQGLLIAAGANPDMKHNDDMDRSKMKANLQKVIDAKDSRFFFGAKLGDSSPGLAIEYAILRYGVQNECGWSLAADQETNRPQAEANGSNGDNDNQYYVAYTVEEGQTQSTKNVFFMGQDYPADFSGGEDLIQIGTYKYFADMNAGSGWSPLRSAVLSYGGTGQAYFYCSGDTSYGNRLGDSKYAEAYAKVIGILGVAQGANLCKPDDTTCTPDSSSTCKIQGGLGWIICPAMSFMATVTSQMYNWIANVLTINPKLFDTSMGTYTAWKMFRDYANIAFVIAFILIMYSQITSVGITNYGIKKMLPKLIIAAILVNISFYVCSLAVDLFNLLGWSVYHLFDGASGTVLSKAGGSGISTSYNDIASWVVGALAIGTVLVVALAAGILAPALIAVLLVFGILLLRQALVVMLIVISPLAIVAYILPNTEKLFRQWMSIFIKVLAVFPIVALVFGGSRLAANVISISNLPGVDSGVSNPGGISPSETMQGLIALGVMTIPFFVVPSLLKKSLEAAGSIGAKVSGLADKGVKRSMNSQSRLAKKNDRAVRKRLGRASRLTGQVTANTGLGRAWQRGRNRLTKATALGGAGLRITPGMRSSADAITREAQSLADADFKKQVEASQIAYDSKGADAGVALDAIFERDASGKRTGRLKTGVSEAQRAATIERVMSTGSFSQRKELVEASDNMSEREKKRVSDGVFAKGDQNIYGTEIGAKIMSKVPGKSVGGADGLRSQTQKNIIEGHVNAEHLVQGEGSLSYLIDVAKGQVRDKDASGNVVFTRSSVAGDINAQRHLSYARDSARTSPRTRATAEGPAVKDLLSTI